VCPLEHNRFRRLHLDIVVQSEPVQGQLVDHRGNAQPFTGWLDLVELIEEHRSRRTCDDVEPTRAERSIDSKEAPT
jgi:hypothetical protein